MHPDVIQARALERATDDAELRVLADVDSFADWLGAAAFGQSAVIASACPADADLSEMPVPDLIAIGLQWPQSGAAAWGEIRRRYLAANAQRIAELAGEVMPAMIEEVRNPDH